MKNKNLLGYSNISFRKPRSCLECKEREIYIEHCSNKITSKIRLRQINRFIDEFLVFINKNYHHSSPKLITYQQVQDYKEHIKNKMNNRSSTKELKLRTLLGWIVWMQDNKLIDQDINYNILR
ncbi:MAG: hypothetical protein ACXWT1_10175 [Methylobacter sp.]